MPEQLNVAGRISKARHAKSVICMSGGWWWSRDGGQGGFGKD